MSDEFAKLSDESPAGRRPVKDHLVRDLVNAIVSGEIPEGSRLPNEKELQERYGVSRTALRETMQHLSAQKLVRTRTRAGTVVLQRLHWNYLDPTVLDAALRHLPPDDFFMALYDARAVFEPAAAAAAAEFATTSQLSAISKAYDEMCKSHLMISDAWSQADLAFHTAILDASGNWVFRQFAVVIQAALLTSLRLTNRATESREHALVVHGDVLEAIRVRDIEAARSTMLYLVKGARQEALDALAAEPQEVVAGQRVVNDRGL